MKILDSRQTHFIDQKTIENRHISSLQLMEEAAQSLFNEIVRRFDDKCQAFAVICGSGNNGGDGLALSRMLHNAGYEVDCYVIESHKRSSDCSQNLQKALNCGIVKYIDSKETIPTIDKSTIIIDAIFGSGLSRNIEGLYADIIFSINNSNSYIISIDVPSGLFDDGVSLDNQVIVTADLTLSIGAPFVSMLLVENYKYVGELQIVNLNLDESEISKLETTYHLTTQREIIPILKKRGKHSHKGTFGHTLIVAGAYCKAGAAVICAKACHRAGTGLLTAYVPERIGDILQIATPETMLMCDEGNDVISTAPSTERFTSIAIGPGIGTQNVTADVLINIITSAKAPLVLDADALNILSMNKDWLKKLPYNTILTPHPKEFERLFGKTENSAERLTVLSKMARELGVIIVLKGAYTAVANSDGKIFFNTTGNPGMATAGSGDALTGVIAALLSQKYSSIQAAILGVYAHGFSGDLAAKEKGCQGLTASDICEFLPYVFKKIFLI